MIQIKRIYAVPTADEGARVLVDRLWPRGVSKEKANLDLWLREIAPSTELRKWFGHDPARWSEFQVRYRKELAANNEAVKTLKEYAKKGNLTLLYGARDELHNEARVILEFLQ